MSLTRSEAEEIWWCLEMPDEVHAATWIRGGLYTYVEDDEGDIICDQPVVNFKLSELRDGTVKPWRDRRSFGKPVCEICEDHVDEITSLRELSQ